MKITEAQLRKTVRKIVSEQYDDLRDYGDEYDADGYGDDDPFSEGLSYEEGFDDGLVPTGPHSQGREYLRGWEDGEAERGYDDPETGL